MATASRLPTASAPTISAKRNWWRWPISSYFAAVQDTAEQNRGYFRLAKQYGFDGVRVFPNWRPDNVGGPCAGGQYDTAPLMRVDGTLHPFTRARVQQLLDIAYEEGLVVELALAHEMVQGITAFGYMTGTQAVAAMLRDAHPELAPPLRGSRHVFLDLQNEFNGPGAGGCKQHLTAANIRVLRDLVKGVDPARLVTASIAYEEEPAGAWMLHQQSGVDIIIAWNVCKAQNVRSPGVWRIKVLSEDTGPEVVPPGSEPQAYVWGRSQKILPGGALVYLVEPLPGSMIFDLSDTAFRPEGTLQLWSLSGGQRSAVATFPEAMASPSARARRACRSRCSEYVGSTGSCAPPAATRGRRVKDDGTRPSL